MGILKTAVTPNRNGMLELETGCGGEGQVANDLLKKVVIEESNGLPNTQIKERGKLVIRSAVKLFYKKH